MHARLILWKFDAARDARVDGLPRLSAGPPRDQVLYQARNVSEGLRDSGRVVYIDRTGELLGERVQRRAYLGQHGVYLALDPRGRPRAAFWFQQCFIFR